MSDSPTDDATGPPIRREYRHVEGRHVHLRRAGTGPPLVMFHASPGSSYRLEPLVAELARERSVWALDTPGYGMSDPLEVPEPSAADYAAAHAETMEAAGLEGVGLYGTHTGAKIALELAVRHPDLVDRLVLDGLGLYTSEERDELLSRYTPRIEPDVHGSHLLRYWGMQRDMHLFWPWYERTADARRDREPPSPERLHDLVVDFLLTGPGYWKGYRAAFAHDTEAALDRLAVPTLITAAPTDPTGRHLDRVDVSDPVTVAAPEPDEDPVGAIASRVVAFLDEGTPTG
jgi:pimeloyl-ACP methyl ester carboxylesterase